MLGSIRGPLWLLPVTFQLEELEAGCRSQPRVFSRRQSVASRGRGADGKGRQPGPLGWPFCLGWRARERRTGAHGLPPGEKRAQSLLLSSRSLLSQGPCEETAPQEGSSPTPPSAHPGGLGAPGAEGTPAPSGLPGSSERPPPAPAGPGRVPQPQRGAAPTATVLLGDSHYCRCRKALTCK